MKIRYQSRHGLAEISILNFVESKDEDLRYWKNGEEKDVADNRKSNFRLSLADNVRREVPSITAIFDAGPDFVDASTGKNPEFSCAVCGREVLEEFFFNGDDRIALENADHQRLCVVHFLLENRQFVSRLQADGMPGDMRAELDEAMQKADAPKQSVAPKPQTGGNGAQLAPNVAQTTNPAPAAANEQAKG